MNVEPDVALVSFCLSHPSRSVMLQALMGGIALPASELAFRAGVSNSTASSHLAQLMQAGLVHVTTAGRHRYYELSNHKVGQIVEAMSVVAPLRPAKKRSTSISHLRTARLCYDHLAGRLGVKITGKLIEKGALRRENDSFILSRSGERFFESLDIDLSHARDARRAFAPVCIDWSERLPHLAGALGAALSKQMISNEWVKRSKDDRSVAVTRSGHKELKAVFGLDWDAESGLIAGV